MNFEELKAMLLDATYTDKQWRELKAIADIRMGNYSAKAAAEQTTLNLGKDYTQLFYSRLENILTNDYQIKMMPFNVVKSTQRSQYKNIEKCAAELYEIACEWNPSKIRNRNFTIGVYHLYSKLVPAYLKDCKVPVSAKACLQHVDKFVGLVDRAFPGYVAGGLIGIVILGSNDRPNSRPK